MFLVFRVHLQRSSQFTIVTAKESFSVTAMSTYSYYRRYIYQIIICICGHQRWFYQNITIKLKCTGGCYYLHPNMSQDILITIALLMIKHQQSRNWYIYIIKLNGIFIKIYVQSGISIFIECNIRVINVQCCIRIGL